jgi:hypothetical protein
MKLFLMISVFCRKDRKMALIQMGDVEHAVHALIVSSILFLQNNVGSFDRSALWTYCLKCLEVILWVWPAQKCNGGEEKVCILGHYREICYTSQFHML